MPHWAKRDGRDVYVALDEGSRQGNRRKDAGSDEECVEESHLDDVVDWKREYVFRWSVRKETTVWSQPFSPLCQRRVKDCGWTSSPVGSH